MGAIAEFSIVISVFSPVGAIVEFPVVAFVDWVSLVAFPEAFVGFWIDGLVSFCAVILWAVPQWDWYPALQWLW